jgi:hypothetical protein
MGYGETTLDGFDVQPYQASYDYNQPYEQGGVTGGYTAPAAPVPTSGSLEGFNADKLESPTHKLESPKYAFADVMQNYGNTPEGFQQGFAELQKLYPDFFGNWQIEGDDSIKWSGEGSLNDAFQGHDSFDVWRNASGEGGGPGGWQWETNRPMPQNGGARFDLSSIMGGGSGSGSGSGGYGGGSGSSSFTSSNPYADEIMQQLRGLFPDGGFNQDIVNRRVDSARDVLNKQRTSRNATNRALLADRGLIGSGPEVTSYDNLEGDLYNQFSGAVNNIYANESENADQRMMEALSLATGMTLQQASQAIDQYRAQTDRDLGFGNLALGNKRADNDFSLGMGDLALGNVRAGNDYQLGLGNLGLGYSNLGFQQSQWNDERMLDLIRLYLGGAGTAADGFI